MKKIIILILVLFVLLGSILFLKISFKRKEIKNYTSDELKFFNEYKDTNIDKDNDVVFINEDNIDSILSNTSVIYIGNYNDENCKKITPLIVNTINGSSIANLYYLDIKENPTLSDIVIKKINKDLSIPMIIFISEGKVNYIYNYDNKMTDSEVYDILMSNINLEFNNNCNEKC